MAVYEIKCFEKRCLKLRIADFTNTPITHLVHPETGETVGDLRVKAYDADGKLLGEYLYEKMNPNLDLCFIKRGWIYLEFDPMPCERPKGYPEDEDWDQLTLAADIIAHKALRAAADNGIRAARQQFAREARTGWTYHRLSHGALHLPQRYQQIDGNLEEVRPKQRCTLRFMLDERYKRCPSCKGLQTKYLLEIAPLSCWIPALTQSKLGASDDWDSITANNLAALANLAYASPDTRTAADAHKKEKREPYDITILHTLDNLRTQRFRPYRVGGEWMDMILHEMPYDWHYHDMQFYAVEDEEKNPTDSQVFMITNKDTIIIAVRGTASGNDVILDGKFSSAASPDALDNVGSVHRGFLQSFEYLWQIVNEYCDKNIAHKLDPKRIFVTGHSLGGAVATLLACALHKEFGTNPITLYTYASPRVGDMDFARYWNARVPHMRHVFDADLISALPPRAFGYHHFGHLRQMALVKAKGQTLPWIGDYGLDQVESAIKAPTKYRSDNAPWGPQELVGDNNLNDSGLTAFYTEEMKQTFKSTLRKLFGVLDHFMEKYLDFLQNELIQREKYAGTDRPLLSYYINAYLLKVRNEYERELEVYLRPVTNADLYGRHTSDLHPLPVVQEEVRRFCRDYWRRSNMLRNPQFELLRQMETEEGLPWGSKIAAIEEERKALQSAMAKAQDSLEQIVQARDKRTPRAMLM
jgi:hypothetical protein